MYIISLVQKKNPSDLNPERKECKESRGRETDLAMSASRAPRITLEITMTWKYGDGIISYYGLSCPMLIF